MDIQVSSVVSVQIALTESEAQEFIADPSVVQRRVYELLFPVNAKSTKPAGRSPKAAARKGGKRTGQNSVTLICPHCEKTFRYRAYFDKHVVKCSAADTAVVS